MVRTSKRVYIGTSGYSYKDWKENFYPKGVDAREYLVYYAKHFSFVELNFSYYRQPSADMITKMIEKTPEGFLFSIKAHQSLTHKRGDDWEGEADIYRSGVKPLRDASRLAGILFQFPYSFHRTVENRKYLERLTGYFSDFPVFLEFRSGEWLTDEVYSSLRDRNIGFVNTDSPELEVLPDKTAVVTSQKGYVRFHGRNRENWWSGDNVSRYDYLYSEGELEEWIYRIEKMLETAAVLYIAFNNHHKGQAVTNAFGLLKLLKS